MSAYKENGKKNVVVVGGGYGANVARSISASLDVSKFNLILINPLPYRIHLVATARMVVSDQDKLEDTAFMSYDKLFHNGKGTFIQALVSSVEKGAVVLDSGERIPYFALVVATGSNWVGPISFPKQANEVSSHIAARRKEFKEANDIVIVGGGAVGIGVSSRFFVFLGDVLTASFRQSSLEKSRTYGRYDNSSMARACFRTDSLDVYPDKFRDRVAKSAIASGIDLIFNDQAPGELEPGSTFVKTDNGKTIKADLVVPAWGNKPNTALLSSLGSDVLSANGFVKIKDTFQLQNYPDVFAIGDIIDVKEQKQAAKAQTHAALVAANVLSFIAGQPPKKKYTGSPELILVTNGKTGGAGYIGMLWGISLGGYLTSKMKGKELLIPPTRASMGL